MRSKRTNLLLVTIILVSIIGIATGTTFIVLKNASLSDLAAAGSSNSLRCVCPPDGKNKVFTIGGLTSKDNDPLYPFNQWINNLAAENGNMTILDPQFGNNWDADSKKNDATLDSIATQIANYITTTGQQVNIVSYSFGAENTPRIYARIQELIGKDSAASCIKHQVLLDPPFANNPVMQCLINNAANCPRDLNDIMGSINDAHSYIASSPEYVQTSPSFIGPGLDFSSIGTILPNFESHAPWDQGTPAAVAALQKFKAGVDNAFANRCNDTPPGLCQNLPNGPYIYMMDSQGNSLYNNGNPKFTPPHIPPNAPGGPACYWSNNTRYGSVNCRALGSGRFTTYNDFVAAGSYASTVSQADADAQAARALAAKLAATALANCGSTINPINRPPINIVPVPRRVPPPKLVNPPKYIKPKPTPTPTPKPTPTPTPTVTPTVTPTDTPTQTPTITPTPAITPTPTATPTPSITPTLYSYTCNPQPNGNVGAGTIAVGTETNPAYMITVKAILPPLPGGGYPPNCIVGYAGNQATPDSNGVATFTHINGMGDARNQAAGLELSSPGVKGSFRGYYATNPDGSYVQPWQYVPGTYTVRMYVGDYLNNGPVVPN